MFPFICKKLARPNMECNTLLLTVGGLNLYNIYASRQHDHYFQADWILFPLVTITVTSSRYCGIKNSPMTRQLLTEIIMQSEVSALSDILSPFCRNDIGVYDLC